MLTPHHTTRFLVIFAQTTRQLVKRQSWPTAKKVFSHKFDGRSKWLLCTVIGWINSQYIQYIKSNQITFIVTSPQHKCLGEGNSYERAPDSAKKQNNNLHMDSTIQYKIASDRLRSRQRSVLVWLGFILKLKTNPIILSLFSYQLILVPAQCQLIIGIEWITWLSQHKHYFHSSRYNMKLYFKLLQMYPHGREMSKISIFAGQNVISVGGRPKCKEKCTF